jgi:arylsulfatase A-like enzyme
VEGKILPGQEYKKRYTSKQEDQNATTRDNRPNIVFILLDDARWDSYQVNGGVPFFPTPNIDRIANEGVNFKICAAVLPLCTPSRGTFFTGLYPHKHGAVTNPDNIQGGLPWISSILQESGYSTYMAGKLGFPPDSVRGFDEYLLSTSEKYIDAKFSYFGPLDDSATTIIPGGHTTDIITDFAADFIRRHADDDHPFFVFIPHRATHVPLIPRPEDDGLFDNDTMPYPDNAEKYQSNFPSVSLPVESSGRFGNPG